MRKIFAISIILFFCIQVQSYGQNRDSLIRAYNSSTIYRFGYKFIKGNETLFFSDLKYEFRTPSTARLYLKSKRKLLVSRIFNLTSLGVVVFSLFHINSVRTSVEYAVVTGALGYAGAYFQSSSAKYLDRAIWERNRDALYGQQQ